MSNRSIKSNIHPLQIHNLLQPNSTFFKDDLCLELCCMMNDKIKDAVIDGGEA